jgi:hypothetical protein
MVIPVELLVEVLLGFKRVFLILMMNAIDASDCVLVASGHTDLLEVSLLFSLLLLLIELDEFFP